MNNETKNNIVPKLRFPEFRDTKGWEEYQVGKLIVQHIEKTDRNKQYPVLTSSRNGIFFQKDYYNNRDVASEDTTGYNVVPRGFFTYRHMSDDLIFKFNINNICDKGIVSTLYPVFSAKQDLIVTYFLQLVLNEGIEFKNFAEAQKQGGSRTYMYLSKLKELIIRIPTYLEQQKIAACLSSLDDLLTAHSQKLEALKAHKKGLMQQLFPVEGETVPRLRFAEFKDSGEWEEKTIGEVAKVTTGNKDTQNKIDKGLYPFFVRSQTVERINSYSFDGEAILTSGDGVGVGKNFHYINGKFDFHQRVYCIYNFSNGICGQFVYLYFSEHFYQRVRKMSAKNSVDSVRMAMITEMPILLPSTQEQQKITACLSSLDELIAAQRQKTEALRQHKKGLMQGLFPNTNDIS